MFGEAQLANLLERVLVPDQYAAQVATCPGSKIWWTLLSDCPNPSDGGTAFMAAYRRQISQ